MDSSPLPARDAKFTENAFDSMNFVNFASVTFVLARAPHVEC
jgi:hypothetical protein